MYEIPEGLALNQFAVIDTQTMEIISWFETYQYAYDWASKSPHDFFIVKIVDKQ